MQTWVDNTLTGLRWLLTALVLVALVFLALLNTQPGHSALEALVAPLSGQTVSVRGLRGDLPDHLQADEVEIRDAKGVWLRIEGLSLDWSALAAINNHIDIENIRATKITLLRMPEPEENSEGTTPSLISAISPSRGSRLPSPPSAAPRF